MTTSHAALAEQLAGLARELAAARTIEETLTRIVQLSVGTISRCTAAGVALVRDGTMSTPVSSAPVVREIDQLQHETNEGPCLDAIASGDSVYAEDLRNDSRWPAFGAQAAHSGLRSVHSICLRDEHTLGALNLYSPRRDAFSATGRVQGLIFATHAALALAAAIRLAGVEEALSVETRRLENLEGALASRQVIGRAEGILMQREKISSDAAFDLLRRASQTLNRKLREVAQHVVDTGEVPE